MSNSWFNVQAAADGKTARVEVRGYIGEWGLNDRDFIAAVEAHGEVDTIEVAINSRGGEVDHALSIFNFLKNHPAKVNMRVEGVAMSAASIILMAGDEIEMPANAILMIHSPWSFASGNAADLRQAADVLDTFESALLETYQARTGKTAEALKTMLAEETFMTAKEAVANGFADRVIALKPEARAASAVAAGLSMAYATALSIPLDVLARAEAEAESLADEGDETPPAIVGFTLTNESGETFWAAPSGHRQEVADAVGKQAVQMNPAQAAAYLAASGYIATPAAKAESPAQPIVIPESLSSRIATAAAEAGLTEFLACFALDSALTDMETITQSMADAREVLDLCGMVGLAEQAPALIRQRASLADARKVLQASMAAIDESSHTDSTPASQAAQSDASVNPAASSTSIWAARRAASHS